MIARPRLLSDLSPLKEWIAPRVPARAWAVLYFTFSKFVRRREVRYVSLRRGAFHDSVRWPTGEQLAIASPRRLHRYFTESRRAALLLATKRYGRTGVKDGDVVLDVGANVGEYTLLAAESASLVIAVEPDPNVLPALLANVSGLPNVVVVQAPLTARSGVVVFHYSSTDADSSLVRPVTGVSASARCLAVTGDLLLELLAVERVDVVKLDAEGAEPEVLAGMSRSLASARCVVVDAGPERSGQSTDRQVVAILTQCGLEVRQHGDGIVYASRVGVPTEGSTAGSCTGLP